MRVFLSLLIASGVSFGQIPTPIGSTWQGASACSLSYTTSLGGWYKADTGTTGTNPVTAWADQSGNSHDLVSSAGTQLLTSQINGLPGISFNGTSGVFGRPSGNIIPAGSGTIFIVSKLNSTASYSAITSAAGSVGALEYFLANSGTMQWANIQSINNIGSGTAASNTNWNQMNLNFAQGATWAFRINRTTDGSGSTVISVTGPIDTIGSEGVGSHFFNGVIAEILVYSTSLSGPNTTTVENYLNCRYGL